MTSRSSVTAGIATRAVSRPMGAPARGAVLAVRLVTVVALLAIWEVLARALPNPYIAPPSLVVVQGVPYLLQPDTLIALAQTTVRFVQAFLLVVVIGVPAGILLGRLHRQLFDGARDVVNVLYALPLVPFYPLFVLWIGLGARSEVAFGAVHGLAPVILITMTASATVPVNLVDAARTMGAGGLRRTVGVVVPAVVPEIVGALKIGASLSLLGVLLGELMISVDAIGTAMSAQIQNHRGPQIDIVVVVVCLGVVVINSVLSAIERRILRRRAMD